MLTAGVLWWGFTITVTAALPASMPHAVLVLIAIRFALGAGEAVIYPAANQFVARWTAPRERGFVNGLIFAGVGAGSGLTPPLLSSVIAAHGWRAAVGTAAAVVWWLVARDEPRGHTLVSPAEAAFIEDAIAPPGAARQRSPTRSGEAWRAMFSRRDLPALMISYFSFGYIAWVYFSWFFLYMAQVRGFDLKASARYTMLPFLCMTVFCLGGRVAFGFPGPHPWAARGAVLSGA